MVSRIWLVNAILALFVAFFFVKAYEVWFEENKGMEVPEMVQTPTPRVPNALVALDRIKIPDESEYGVLMSQNLFSPERTEILPEEANPAEGKETISAAQQKNLEQFLKKITLYGMVITESSAEALISDVVVEPAVKKGRSLRRNRIKLKKTKWVKVGDALGEFQIADINPEGILLKAGAVTFDLRLYDAERIKKRVPVKPREGPTVVGTEGPTVVGTAGAKPEVAGDTEKGALPVPVEKKIAPPQSDDKGPSEKADNYEDFLRRAGNKKALEAFREKKR
jgi:hypothetical protein